MRMYFFVIVFCSCSSGLIGQNRVYEYDKLSRLTRINYSNGSSVLYQYDANGNRTFQFIVGTTTTYVFNGNGNWSVAANWQNQVKPPLELPAGSIIVIDPVANGECVLDVAQKILPGGTVRVEPGKKLRIPDYMRLQLP